MAFGLFKKKNTADIIYKNAHIYTQDPEFPWAEAVACKDGSVLAVGDFEAMDEILSSDTEVIDLDGKYMFPGFIDVHGTPSLKALENLYLSIDPIWDLDTVLEAVSDYAQNCEEDIIFGYGYNDLILKDYDPLEERKKLLDEIETDRPIVLLGTSGYRCWINSAALAIIAEAAEEEGIEFMHFPLNSLLMNILPPFDYDTIAERVRQRSLDLADRGFTSVLDLCAPDFFAALYRDALVTAIGESEPLYQRFFGSLYINRPLQPHQVLHRLTVGHTACTELDNMVSFDIMKVDCSQDEHLAYFPEDTLFRICLAAAEKGFAIHLDALDAESYEQAREMFTLLRDKGCKHNTFVLASDREPEEDAPFVATWPTDFLDRSFVGHVNTVQDAIDQLTVKAAEILGKSRELGSIERGKLADFTVFAENPFDMTLRKFSDLHADMTILDSLVVYDVEEANAEEMYDLMTSMRL